MRVTEEVGEIRDVLLKPTKFTEPQAALKDAIGDTLVTIIVLAHQLDLDVTECLGIAYEEIKNRKGKMIMVHSSMRKISRMIVWALFDSGNGSYTKAVKKLDEDIEIYPIGIDIENKNHHFINLNLADYSRLFGNNTLFDTLDKLPKPDLIIASPPCESWSNASAMDRGNACWKQEQGDSLFQPQEPLSIFTVRDHKDYDRYQYYPNKQLMKRINGELCVFNTVEIIKRYNPKYWIIENPAHGRIWQYIERVLGFEIPFENHTRYNNYDDYPISKPTRFSGNIELNLKNEKKSNDIKFQDWTKSYNERSNIPLSLVCEILKKVYKGFMSET